MSKPFQPIVCAERYRALSCAVLMSFGAALPNMACADERTDLETLKQTTLNLIQILVQQGVLNQDKADQLVKQAEVKAIETVAAQKKSDSNVVRVQYVPEAVRKQIADQVREEVVAQAKVERWGDANAIPEWVDRLKLEGDLRVGFQGDMFAKSNAPEIFHQVQGQNVANTTENRDRMTVRARLGLNAKVTPEVSAVLRLTTGSSTSPVSTSQTLGQYGSKYGFSLDRAYVRAHSDDFIPWVTASVGRIPNPWFGTDLVWNDNLNFEGIAVQLEPLNQSTKTWRPFATLGAFPMQEVEQSTSVKGKDKWLVGAQVGIEWVPDNRARAKFGLAYYDFHDVSGIRNSNLDTSLNTTAAFNRQKGNTLFNITNPITNTSADLFGLAGDYQLINLTGVVDLNMYNPVHVILSGDYVKNVGFSKEKVLARTGFTVEPETMGYMARVAVGMPTMVLKNDWQVSLAYRYLERDAVLDAFTDSDFHLGGTNNKGFILGAQYGLGKNTWLSARWMSSNEISGSRCPSTFCRCFSMPSSRFLPCLAGALILLPILMGGCAFSPEDIAYRERLESGF